jgi:1-acyl-sn-glycerol-3-phosphate acyltransferase
VVSQTQNRSWGLLGNRNFILLWCAYGISAMGDHLSELAILKTQHALDAEVDITQLYARLTFMFFLPFFLLAPLAGVLADRLPRRGVMIAADLVRCLIMLVFASLIAVTAGWGTWGPFVPLALLGTFAGLFSPARQALLPTVVHERELVRANGLISGLGIIATMVSTKFSGYLADNYPAVISFRLDAVTYVTSAVCLFLLRPPPSPVERPSARTQRPVRELMNGFRYAASHRHVTELLILSGLVWFCGPLVSSAIPAVVRDIYGGTYGTIADYRFLLGLGFVLGACTIAVLGDALQEVFAITWGFMGVAVGIAVFALSVFLPAGTTLLMWIGGAGIVLSGMFGVGVIASLNSLLQRTVADRFRGRVFGVRDVCTTGSLLLATGLLGLPQWVRMDRWVGYILVGVAVVTFAAGVWTLRVRLRRGQHGAWVTFLYHSVGLFARFWWRYDRVGPSTVPHEGPVVVTSNHVCAADPLLLSLAVPYRRLSFLVAAEYVQWRVIRYFANLTHCIPVRRGTRETSATKQAMRHLRDGGAVAIFIEGGIVKPGDTPRPKDGVALLALRTGARVVPARIDGAVHRGSIVAEVLGRHRARVRFGPPVDLSEFGGTDANRETVRAATRKIYNAIQALAPQEAEAAHAERVEVPQ